MRSLLGIGVLLAFFAAPATAQQSVKIGFVDTFSGPTAVIGGGSLRSAGLMRG